MRIVIIDDEPRRCRSFVGMLEEEGHNAVLEPDPLFFWHKLVKSPAMLGDSILILNCMMRAEGELAEESDDGLKTGVVLLKKMRRMGITNHVIAWSAYQKSREWFGDLAQDFLLKPVRSQELLTALERFRF